MDQFPSNAHIPTNLGKPVEKTPKVEEKPRVQRVVEGNVIRRKKNLGKRVSEHFFGNTKGIGTAVLFEIMIPAARDMLFEGGKDALERALFPESARGSRRRSSGPTNYRAISGGGLAAKAVAFRDETRQMSRRGRATHNFDEIVLPSRREAEDVIAQMFEILERFDSVMVSDLYEMMNITPDYTDRKFGWVDLSDAHVSHIKDGYLLDLPRPEPLD